MRGDRPLLVLVVFVVRACGDSGSSVVHPGGGDASGGGSGASCSPGLTRCVGASGVQTCNATGQWSDPWACATGTCSGGACAGATTSATSCQASDDGLTTCGANRESCCTSLEVAGGTFYRTYDDVNYTDGGYAPAADGGPADQSDPATVSGFRLDKYLVTVGRFRQFVSAWSAGYTPAPGSGKHAHLSAGRGLAGTAAGYEPGWGAADDSNVQPTDTNLGCGTVDTWTPAPGSQENLPINCLVWWEAYAFCIWDGGFLPSEAEWEYAAAGGSQQREYPWGSSDPGTLNQYAIYGDGNGTGNCYYPTGGACSGVANVAPVGTATLGAGRWGHLDLAGDMFEWNLDWYAPYVTPAVDSAHIALDPAAAADVVDASRVIRGGAFFYTSDLAVPYRNFGAPSYRSTFIGFRCARTP